MSEPVRISELRCGSALQHARQTAPARIDTLRLWPGEPPILLCRVDDVLYLPSALDAGQSLQVLGERLVPLEATDPFTLDFVQRKRRSRTITTYDQAYGTAYVERDVCILGNVFSRNFTHWHEELLKVIVLQSAGVECDFVISQLPDFARQSLHLLNIPPSRIHDIDHPTRFRSAFYSTPITYENVWQYPGVLLSLREGLDAAAEAEAPVLGSRVWLDRGEQTRLGRKLINTEEVYRCLEEFDVERFDMGAAPLQRQIAVARRINVMAGLHGAHFVHSQLMPPRSLIIECFSPLYLNPTFTSIYHVLDHHYCQISGTNTPVLPYPHGGDVEVDCLQLRLALKQA